MELIDAYLRFMASGTAARGTLIVRRSHLTAFARTVPDLLSATETDLTDYLADTAYASETRRSHRSSLRGFYKWAKKQGLIEVDPAVDLLPIRQRPGIPHPIPEQALADAMARANQEQLLMLVLGAYAGLRRQEIAAVHSDHISHTTLQVRGKGDKWRAIPLHPRVRQLTDGLNGYAFPGRFAGHVGGTYVRDHLRPVLGTYTPHSLRHRFGTVTYRACHDLTVVQKLMGHSSVQTTMLYVQVDQEQLAAAVMAVA